MRRRSTALPLLLLVVGCVVAIFGDAHAETVCPEGNLLSGARIRDSYDAYHTERLTDRTTGPPGEHWLSDRNTLFTSAGRVVFELPRLTRVRFLVLQADANDAYRVSGSVDGTNWRSLGEVPPVEGTGMQTRWASGLDLELRYLRVEPGRGDGDFSVGEIAAYCREPDPWPPRFEIRPGVVRDESWVRARQRRVAAGKIGYGLLAGVLLLWIGRTRDRPVSRPARRWLLGAIVVGGALAWINFGTFHGLNVWHHHELFHYVLGSKYFEENRYTGLYRCTETAEAESGRRAFVERRVIRNLETNELEPATVVLADPQRCKTAFSPPRWEEFERDVEFYRSRDYPGSWGAIFRDHGYNASPVWTLFGGAIAGLDALSRRPAMLVAVDFTLYAALFALIGWSFGLEVAAIAAVIWGVGLPWEYAWTGGGFARVPWLFLGVGSVCLMRRSRSGLGGAALAGSALLRVFPAVLATGPLIRCARELARTKRLSESHRRFLIGGILACVVLVPLASWSAAGFGVWGEFFDNLRKHADSPLGNDVGLPVLFAWDASNVQSEVLTGRLDEFAAWEQTRRDTFAARRPWYLATALGLAGLFLSFVLRWARSDWETVCAGILPVLALSELASYYTVFFVLLAPFGADRPRRTALLVGTVVLSQCLRFPGFSVDTLFMLQSLLLVVATVAVLLDVIHERRGRRPPAEDPG